MSVIHVPRGLRDMQCLPHGAGTRPSALRDDAAGVKPVQRTVADIYRRAASTHPWALFLFKLVRAQRPERVLELGTNLGVAAAYLNAALDLNGTGHLTTIEGDPTLAELASEHLEATSERAADVIQGRFQDVLPKLLPRVAPLDLVFLDGHHEDRPTRDYFAQIAPHLAPHALVVFDDVEPWRGVYRAYRAVMGANPGARAVHLGKIALLQGDGSGWRAC